MRKLVVFVLFLGTSAGCSSAAGGGDGGNLLLGHWVSDVIPVDTNTGKPETCAASLDFTATHQHIVYGGIMPNVNDADVTYNASKDYVYVIGTGGISTAARYNLAGPGRITFNGYPPCGYKRTP